MAKRTTDIDRALTSIRGRADHLRFTISRLEHNLAWNPTMTWPEFLGQFLVVSKQLENMNEEIPEMIEHFVCIPKQPTPNPSDIPLLLRTREDPEMEEKDEKLIAHKDSSDKVWEALRRKIDKHNDLCESIEENYKQQSEALMKELRVDKYTDKAKPTSTQQSLFKFIDTGKTV